MIRPLPFLFASLIILALLVPAGAGNAQEEPARSFLDLQSLVPPGQTVTVRDATGQDVRGRLQSVTDTTLVLAAGSSEREFAEGEVQRVRRRNDDSMSNGIGIGAAIGAVIGVVAGTSEEDSDTNYRYVGGLVLGGIGAVVGALTDGFIRSETTVYEAPASPGGSRVRIAPLLRPGRAGVAASIGF